MNYLKKMKKTCEIKQSVTSIKRRGVSLVAFFSLPSCMAVSWCLVTFGFWSNKSKGACRQTTRRLKTSATLRILYQRRLLRSGMLLALLPPGDFGVRNCRLVQNPLIASAEPTSTTTATTTSPASVAATTAAAAEASHLSQTRVNLLLCLLKNVDKLTSLLLVYHLVSTPTPLLFCLCATYCQW